MMDTTYLFYDIETTGLNKCFDQILQFAAIRTDMDLNEIGRYETLIKLNTDVIPSPRATITHRISIKSLESSPNEFDAISQIHHLINQPGTISVGYNSLRFDDEFLRFSFYRNLLSPYTHQYANNCGRMDIFPMVIMFYLFEPGVLKWPIVESKVSLKLENLAAMNQLLGGAAHNAMVDTEATLSLARILKEKQTMWNYLTGYFDKRTDLTRASQLPTTINHFPEAIMITSQLGTNAKFHCPVLGLGQHYHYKNQTLWLRLDDERLKETHIDNVQETTYSLIKKNGEPGLLLPNKARFQKHLTEERLQFTEANKKWLQDNPKILHAIAEYYLNYTYPKIPNLDANGALYENGFWTNAETYICDKFHHAALEEKIRILSEINNPILRELALRILGRNFNQNLPNKLYNEYNNYLKAINTCNDEETPVDYRGEKHLTPRSSLKNIEDLRSNGNLEQQQIQLLDELEHYLITTFKEGLWKI